jgi:hypothetical protein
LDVLAMLAFMAASIILFRMLDLGIVGLVRWILRWRRGIVLLLAFGSALGVTAIVSGDMPEINLTFESVATGQGTVVVCPFADNNKSGTRQPSEPCKGGYKVDLWQANAMVATKTTSTSTGQAVFYVPAGLYYFALAVPKTQPDILPLGVICSSFVPPKYLAPNATLYYNIPCVSSLDYLLPMLNMLKTYSP